MQEPKELWVGVGGGGGLLVPSVYFIHSYACNLSLPNGLSNVWGSIYTIQVLVGRKTHRRKAKDFGRINGEAELLKPLLI